MTKPAFFPPAPFAPSTYDPSWAQKLVEVVNTIAKKTNNAADLTLTASATSTVMKDARLSAFSVLTFMATTPNAAAVASGIYVTGQKKGEATVHHASNANTDKTFSVGILG